MLIFGGDELPPDDEGPGAADDVGPGVGSGPGKLACGVGDGSDGVVGGDATATSGGGIFGDVTSVGGWVGGDATATSGGGMFGDVASVGGLFGDATATSGGDG
jgi:hypothetical protein